MNTELNARYSAVEDKKEKLVTDLKGIVADADDLLNEVARATVEEFAGARTKIEGRLAEARSRLDDARIAVADKARSAADATQEYVRENPWRILGIAAAGLVIGILLRRR